MTIRKIDHKQLKARDANVGDILRVTGSDDLAYVDPNNIVVGALTAGDNIAIEANGLIVALAQAFTGNSSIVPEGANLYFTNTRTIDAVQAADDLVLGNLIPKSSGVYDLGNSTVRWNRLYLEGSTLVLGNLFLKDVNGQMVVADTEDGVTSNGLTTDAVPEQANNLYFTNSRVAAYIDDNITTSNIVEGTRVYFTNARAIAAVQDNISTSNVIEGANLYFTNARAVGALTAGSGISIDANGLIQSTGEAAIFTGTTDGITEGTSNLYYTNARVEAFVESNITTSNIAEGANLYFSNDRAIGAFTAGDNIAIEANGLVIGQPGYSDENAYANSQIWFANATTSNIAEGANLYFTNDRVVAALTGGDNITIESNGLITGQPGYTDENAYANAQIWLANTTTSNVAEGANLYFTNDRAIAALSAGSGIVIESNGLIVSNATATFDVVEVGDLTVTGNLVITGNATTIESNILQIDDPLIHLAANNETSDAVDIGFLGHYSPDSGTTRQHAGIFRKHNTENFYVFSQYVDEALDSGNLITNIDTANNTFRLATVYANTFVGNVTGQVSDIANHDTDALAEGASNLYFSNARALAAVADNITTSNVAEGSNLYFTNARSVAALTAGDGIVIESNGLVMSNATASFDSIEVVDLTVGVPQFGSLAPANTTSSFYHSIQSTTLTNNFSLSFWLYIPSDIPNGTYSLLEKIQSNLSQIQLSSFVQISSGLAYIWLRNNPSNLTLNIYKFFSIASSGWHYITYSYDQGAGIFYLGADGSVTNDQSFNVDWTGGDLNVYFGHRIGSGGSTGTSTLFKFADVGLRTTLDYTTNFTPPTSHPTASDYYFLSLAKTSADKLVDSGTSGSNFVEFGSGTTFNSDNPFPAAGSLTVYGNVTGIVSSISNHNTDDLAEGSNNLYFTNARSVAALTAGDNIAIEANGLIIGEAGSIYADENAYANAQVWFANITTSNVTEGANLYFSNTRAIEAVELAVTKLDVVNNSASAYRFDQYGATTDNPSLYVTAGETIAFDLAVTGHPFVIRASAGGSNVSTGLVHVADDGIITNDSSAQGKETGVLYWKVPWDFRGNTYVYQCTVHGGMVGNIVVKDPSTASVDFINASNVIETGNTTTGNVFFTNARALAAIVDNITTSNVAEGANLYFSNDRAIGAFTAGNNITIEANGLVISAAGAGDIYASNVIEDGNTTAGNVFFTNTRAIAALTAGSGVTIESNGLIISTASGTFSGNTDAVPEGTANLYFTNARSVGSLTAGTGINIAANGLITSTGSGGNVGLAYSEVESNVIVSQSGVLIYDMGRTVSAPEDVLIIVEGLVQIANVDYTVNANTLTFTNEIHANANIELRFFGLDAATNVYATATLSYDQANAAYAQANAAYEQANTSTTGPILLNNTNITSNITIVSGQNGLAVGPLTLDANVSINIAPGQRFLIL